MSKHAHTLLWPLLFSGKLEIGWSPIGSLKGNGVGNGWNGWVAGDGLGGGLAGLYGNGGGAGKNSNGGGGGGGCGFDDDNGSEP